MEWSSRSWVVVEPGDMCSEEWRGGGGIKGEVDVGTCLTRSWFTRVALVASGEETVEEVAAGVYMGGGSEGSWSLGGSG